MLLLCRCCGDVYCDELGRDESIEDENYPEGLCEDCADNLDTLEDKLNVLLDGGGDMG